LQGVFPASRDVLQSLQGVFPTLQDVLQSLQHVFPTLQDVLQSLQRLLPYPGMEICSFPAGCPPVRAKSFSPLTANC
jgi:hypothetical protein